MVPTGGFSGSVTRSPSPSLPSALPFPGWIPSRMHNGYCVQTPQHFLLGVYHGEESFPGAPSRLALRTRGPGLSESSS